MIFWWSEARLASFIKNYISKGHIQDDRGITTRMDALSTQADARFKSVEDRLAESVRNMMQVNSVLLAHENEMKRLNDEIRNKTTDDVFARVLKDYEDEKQKTAKLTEIVQKQSEGIASLSQMVEELRSQVAVLNSKLASSTNGNIASDEIPSPANFLVFNDDVNANKCKLMMLIEHAELLKKSLVNDGMALEDVYVKLVQNMLDKLNKLSSKNAEKQYAADKLANETVKILRQTIVKGMTQEKLKDHFLQYMNECGIRKLAWSVGRKITNDDYEYLEEPIVYEEVSDERLIGTITEIIQDTYVIDYYDDDDKYEAIIPGQYRIGKGAK